MTSTEELKIDLLRNILAEVIILKKRDSQAIKLMEHNDDTDPFVFDIGSYMVMIKANDEGDDRVCSMWNKSTGKLISFEE